VWSEFARLARHHNRPAYKIIQGRVIVKGNCGDKYLNFTELPAKPIKEIEIKLPAITRYKSQYVPPANHPWRNFQFGNTQEVKQRIKD